MERKDLSELSVLEMNQIALECKNTDDLELLIPMLDREMERRRSLAKQALCGVERPHNDLAEFTLVQLALLRGVAETNSRWEEVRRLDAEIDSREDY